MAAGIQNVSLMNPYWMEQQDIERRRKIAEALQSQSMQPIEQTPTPAGGFAVPIAPTQGLAKIAQALIAGYGQKKSRDESKALGERYTRERGDVIAQALKAGEATPERTIQPDPQEAMQSADFGTPEVGAATVPGAPANRARVYEALAKNTSFPDLQAAGLAGLPKERIVPAGASVLGPDNQVQFTAPPRPMADNRPEILRLQESLRTMPANDPNRAGLEARIKFLGEGREQADKGNWGEPYQMGGAWVQKNDATGQVRQAVGREPTTHVSVPPPITAVTIQDPNDPNGTIIVDGRTQKLIGKGPKLTQVGGAEQKLSLGLPQAKLRVESVVQNLDRLNSAMSTLSQDPGLTRITGTLMGRTPNITNTATGAQAQLNSIKAQIFQSSLQAMRESSKTGGAVGNVSDREGDKLERTLAALDQAQGTPDFQRQLNTAIAQVRQSKELIRAAFDEQYGGVQGRSPQGSIAIPDTPPPGAVRRK